MPSHADSLHLVTAGMGFVSFTLLWVAVVTGFLLRNAWTQTWVRRPMLHAIHQTAAVMGVCLAIFHGLAQLAAPGAGITLVEVVLPFIHIDDPIGIGAGVLALELLIGVALSVAIQRTGSARPVTRLHQVLYRLHGLLVIGHLLGSPWAIGNKGEGMAAVRSRLAAGGATCGTTTGPAPGSGAGWLDTVPRRVAIDAGKSRRSRVDRGRCATGIGSLSAAGADSRTHVRRRSPYACALDLPCRGLDYVMRAVEACPTRTHFASDRPHAPSGAGPSRYGQHGPEPMSPWAVAGRAPSQTADPP